MWYRTTDFLQKTIRIIFTVLMPIVELLQWLPAQIDSRKISIGSFQVDKKIVQGSFVATFLGLIVYMNFLLPAGPMHVKSTTTLAPVESGPIVAQQDWKISTVSIPVLEKPVTSIKVGSPGALEIQLKSLDLWEFEEFSLVPPVVFTNFPNRLSELNVGAKKRMFLHSLLPVALVAMAEVEQERAKLQIILGKLGDNNNIVFSDNGAAWQEQLSNEEQDFIVTLTQKYRTEKAAELLDRVDVLPVSLILAQGAFESFWGTSRFAREGNNLFGMWTWGEKGIVPARRAPGKTHKLAIYDTILGSVRDFVLTLNRLSAYDDLRKLRQYTMDSVALADGLFYYSERGNAYIKDIKEIIYHNDLTRFDSLVLGDSVDRLSLKQPVSL